MARIERLNTLYGPGGKLGVGRTKFWQDLVFNGTDEFVPGTDVPRLQLVSLGKRAKGAFEDEVDALIEGLRRWRDRQRLRKEAPAEETTTLA